MTNLEQVKNLLSITNTTNDTYLTDWLIAGGRVIADMMPMDKLSQFSTVVSPAAQSYDLTNKKFISINSTNGSHFIPTSPEIFIRSSTDGSIYKTITDGNQYYTIDGDLLKVTVIANSLKTYTYPTVTSENVTNLPNEYIHGAVLYAAINTITKLLKDKTYEVSEDTATLTLTSTSNLINTIYTHSFDLPVTHNPFPDIAYSGSSATGPSTVEIEEIEDLVESFVPLIAFTVPTISYALDTVGIALPTNIANTLLEIVSEDVSPLLSDLSTDIIALDAYFLELDNLTTGYINSLEDVELAASKMSEMQVKLKEVETELTLKLQEQLKNIEQKNDVEKQNKAAKLSALIQKADFYLKRYAAELQKFQAQFTLRANEAQLKQQGEIARLKGEIDIQTAKASEQMLIFKTAVEKLFEQAKIDLQRELQLSSLTTDVEQKNAVAEYQKTVSSNEAAIKAFSVDFEQWVQTQTLKLGKFKSIIEFYLAENQSKIQVFQAKTERDIAFINANIQNNENEKQKLALLKKALFEEFNMFIMLMFPRQQPAPQQ